jgi:NADH-quinone oxidoreductase subunit H
MTRFFTMILVLAAMVAGIVGLMAVFYLVAYFAAWALSGADWSPVGAYFGASIANVVTLMLVLLMVSASLLTVAERKWSAMMQNRIGANRITVFGNALGGLPFLVADALKMLTKERVEPRGRFQLLYELAPIFSFAPVFALFAVVPVGPPLAMGDFFAHSSAPGGLPEIALQVARTDTGLLYLFAIASLQVYGTSLAGWASNNKLARGGGGGGPPPQC